MSKQHIFCCVLDPGTYEIINYKWADGTWYGAKIYTEPIFKNVDATDSLYSKIKSGVIKAREFKYYRFTMEADSLCYLGVWDFTTGLDSFTDRKSETDQIIKKDLLTLDFDQTITIIPE